MAQLLGKVALITGGSKGIGKATALRLAKDGAKVAINYSSDSKAADEVVAAIGKDNAIAIKGDAASVKDGEIMVAKTVEKWGKVDILILNAGNLPMTDLEHATEEGYDKVMNLMVKGPLFLTQKAVPHMGPGSHVIFLSTSLAANSNIMPGYLLYVATKGAIEQITRVLAKDLGRKKICVNAIAPGPTATELFLTGKPDSLIQMLEKHSPFNRLGEAEEIANVMAFLSSNDSGWVSGQVLRVNGASV